MPKISGVCVGELLVGDGNEVAHVDLLLGPRGSAVETAYCIALTNNKDGFTTLLALVAPTLMCKPATILYNKVTIKDARQAVQMFGPAQHAVAKAVANSVAEGVIPVNEANDLYITVGVFIHWEAKDDKKIQDYQLSRDEGSHRSRRPGRAEGLRSHREEGDRCPVPPVRSQLKGRTGRGKPGKKIRWWARLAVAPKAGFLMDGHSLKSNRRLAPVPCPGLSDCRLGRGRSSASPMLCGWLLMEPPRTIEGEFRVELRMVRVQGSSNERRIFGAFKPRHLQITRGGWRFPSSTNHSPLSSPLASKIVAVPCI